MADSDFFDTIASAIIESAFYAGIPKVIAGDLSRMVCDRLRSRLGGVQAYVRSTRPVDVETIIRAFDGRNIPDIARRYGITTRRVRQILNIRPTNEQ